MQLLPELEYTDAVDSWNVRASPELDSFVLCVLQAGQPFSVLGEQEDWLHIRTENGVKGWSYKKFGDRQVLVPVGHVGNVTVQPELSTKSSGDLSGLMSELGERRRSLSEAPKASAELVRAAQGVQKTMAKLELYGIEQARHTILFEGTSKAGLWPAHRRNFLQPRAQRIWQQSRELWRNRRRLRFWAFMLDPCFVDARTCLLSCADPPRTSTRPFCSKYGRHQLFAFPMRRTDRKIMKI